MSVGLSYNTFNTGNTNATSSASNGGSIWDSVFGNLGNIFQGAGSLVRDIKTDYNQVAKDQAAAATSMNWAAMFGGGQQRNPNNSIIWIIIGVLVLGVVIFFATRK